MLDGIDVWGLRRPGQQLELAVVFLKPFPNHFCRVAGSVNLLKEAKAIRAYNFHEGVYLVCDGVYVGWYTAGWEHPPGPAVLKMS